MSVKKIASAAIQNRSQTPFWNYIRNKLLAVDRQPITPPPGLPTPDGKAIYHNHLRFPNTQSARTPPEEASVPGGVHHRLAANYYLDRDARRHVEPPTALESKSVESKSESANAQVSSGKSVYVNKGPDVNFGLLNVPTPGFGHQMSRRSDNELHTQKNDTEFKRLEKFDDKMRPSLVLLGKQFGQLGKVYGEYRFSVAPSEQKPMHNFFYDGFWKVFKFNVLYTWHMWLPQTIGAYLLYDWAVKANYKANRKNPKDYENDE